MLDHTFIPPKAFPPNLKFSEGGQFNEEDKDEPCSSDEDEDSIPS